MIGLKQKSGNTKNNKRNPTKKKSINSKSNSTHSVNASVSTEAVHNNSADVNVTTSNGSLGVPNRIRNTILGYTIKSDNDYVNVIKEAVIAGELPIVLQDSKIITHDFSDTIRKLKAKTDDLPNDYVPNVSKNIAGKADKMEVKIL